MKVDTTRLKKGTSELTLECRQLIEDMTARKSRQELLKYLETLRGWVYGKCELYHWIEILDRFDDILSEASKENPDNEFSLHCDTNYAPADVRLLLYVINFTTLLIEHSFSRHLYNSIEYLTQLLSSTNMDVVMCVLNLLYMFSKRSNFIPRLNNIKKVSLLTKLYNFAESWGGKENGFSLAQCCKEEAKLPVSSSTLYFEYYNTGGKLDYIEVPGLDKMRESAATIAKVVCDKIPHLGDDQRMHILTRIRLAATFRNYRMRLQFVQARLQAISVLVYSNALQDNIHTLLYPGFLDELVELLEIKDIHLVEIRAAALRTLTSIIHLDRNPHFPKKPGSRLSKIIEVTGAALYHGFLPTLVRSCINHLISMQTKDLDLVAACSVIHQCTHAYRNPDISTRFDTFKQTNQFPLSLATALFSFLYHLASYEAGGEALVSCGMMESLLRVINWPGVDLEHITFVTRAVRVIDLITNIDMHSFHSNNGLRAFIQRLEVEVNHCRQFQLTMREKANIKKKSIIVDKYENIRNFDGEDGEDFDGTDAESAESIDRYENEDSNFSFDSESPQLISESLTSSCNRNASTSSTTSEKEKKITCVTQRAALLKSMLNFLKKSIQDSAYNSGMRNIMESSLPRSLRNIISNAEYYGPSLFLLATDVITVYVFQEPSLLSTLQDSGLTDIVLQSLLRKEVPATREVLGSLPNVFSALCLNARGLEEFSSYKPFDRLFQVLLSPAYLVAMRRRRSSDPLGDTATNLGNAMDDLMKHHPSLRTDALKSIIKLLIELVRIGSDPHFICWRATNNGKSDSSLRLQSENVSRNQNKDAGNGSSGDDDDDEEISTASQQRNDRNRTAAVQTLTASGFPSQHANHPTTVTTPAEREPVPLIDYILNVMKFIDAIISNGTNGEHCREFVSLGGLQPLLSILSLPNLPVDSPVTTTAQAVATVCKSILNQAHDTKVVEVAIVQLSQIVEQLNPLVIHMNSPEGSILLRELTNCPKKEAGFSNAAYTPLLHAMSAVHGYVVMLVHICRSSQNDIRVLLLRKWGVDCTRGKKLLQSLVQLYTSLVWESTILLGMCSDENVPKDVDFSYDSVTRIQSAAADIDDEFPEQTNSETFPLLSASTSESLSRLPTAQTIEENIATTSEPRSTGTSASTFSTPFSSTFGLIAAPTSATTHEILTQRSVAEDNMEIDDDVVCLTPMPTANNAQQSSDVTEQSAIETTDEPISIDSATSSSSDSVVYIPPLSEEQENEKKIEEEIEHITQKQKSEHGKDGNHPPRPQSSDEANEETKRREKACINQVRFIKALLAASSRLGRALAELFGNLVKLCVGTPGRQRRPNELLSASKFPYTEAGDIARVLSYILVNGFCYDKIVSPGAPKLKLTFLICSVGFTGPMLFDEKRYAFHLMLSQFCEEGGLEAFFDMFRWALTYGCASEDKNEFMKGTEYAEGTGEFLDAWLLLLEKMVNPRAIFESPHYIISHPLTGPSNQLLDFEPVFYMVKVHSLALKALCDIWDKKPLPNYGVRMAESIMAIMKHIIKNESMLREKYVKRRDELRKLEQARQVYRDSVKKTVNFSHLQLFMDMGFSEVHVSEALANTNTVEQATDFLLNRPESDPVPRVMPYLAGVENDYDDDDDDDDDDEDEDDEDSDSRNVNETTDQPGQRRSTQSPPPPPPQPPQQIPPESKNKKTWKSVVLPDPATIDNFCREAFDKTFNTMDHLPETVTSGADLLAVLYRHHSPEMKQKFILTLVQNITDWTEKILHNLKARDALNSVKREEILIGRYGIKMFIRLKIGCLLLDEIYRDMRKSFCTAIRHEKSLSTLIMLLHKIESILQEQISLGAPPITPRWLQHLIEFIDAIDNSCLIMQRKANMLAVTTKTWKWFDSSAGKWNTYSVPNNTIIHNAFMNGERSVRITCGRQKYTINFNCMSQVNEATGNHRPIIPGLKIMETNETGSKIESSVITFSTSSDSDSDSEDQSESADGRGISQNSAARHSSLDKDNVNSGKLKSNVTQLIDNKDGGCKLEENVDEDSGSTVSKVILHEEPTGLQQYDTGAIVSCLVRLLRPKLAIDLETINSILKLCVRLTKEYENAKVFAQSGGIKLLLNMRQMCGYMGFPTYAILLIRHVLEEPGALLATMERVIATRTISAIPSGHRDIIFVLRQMSSAVARDPKIFIRAASNVLRFDHSILKTKTDGLDDLRLIVKASTLIKKFSPLISQDADNTASCSSASKTENNVPVSVINDLLKALVLPCSHFPSASDIQPMCEEQPALIIGGIPATKNSFLATNAASLDKTQIDDSQSDQCCGWHIPSSSHLHDKPLLTRSTILKILADAVRSYQSFAPKLITEHVYVTSDSILVQRDQTALSFIMDNFLPQKENSQDREVSTMARVLITSLSDCVDQLSIQNAVIVEVKAAMQRAINLPECSEKHMRLQVLVGLLPSMIDNPPPLNKIAPHRNEIFLMLLRKGIMSDLAKMVLHLDLSNPSSVTTLNSVLKPMETLLRLTVAPGILLAKKKTSNLQSNRRGREQPPTAVIGRSGVNTGRPLLSRRATNSLEEENIHGVIADRSRATGFFFAGDLARTGDQFNHIFDGILDNEHGFFNGGVVMGPAHAEMHINDVLNEHGSPVADATFETSSESSDSESNASEDNEDRDGDEDDANEEPAENRSEADADEETRQFIEVFDHVYAPDQPRASSSGRNLDGVPIVRYTVTSNVNAGESTTNSVASTSAGGSMSTGGGLTINDNRISSLVHQARQNRSANASVLSRSFNPIQHQQHPGLNIGIIRSTTVVGQNATAENSNSNMIDDELIARFNYYIHHGQTLSNGSGAVPSLSSGNSASNVTNTAGALGSLSSVSFNSNMGLVANGLDSADGRTSNSNTRLQRDSRRLLFVDQQYCTPASFNNADESQNELFNQDALHWWLEEAKNLDMESQPNICLIVAHQIIPKLKELRNKTIKRKRKTTPGAPPTTISSETLVSGEGQETVALLSPSINLNTSATAASNNSANNSNNRRSAIPVLVTRNPDHRDTQPSTDNDVTATGNPNVSYNPTDSDNTRTLRRGPVNNITRRSTRSQNRNLALANSEELNTNRGSEPNMNISAINSDDDSQPQNPLSEQSSENINQIQEAHNHSQETIRIAEANAGAALVPSPDDGGVESNDYEEEEEDDDNDDDRDNDDNDEEDEDDEEELNVEDVIMDFDDEIENVLSQFSSSVRPQEIVGDSSVSGVHNNNASQRDQLISNQSSNISDRTQATIETNPTISESSTTVSLPSVSISVTSSSLSNASSAARTSSASAVPDRGVIPGLSPVIPEISAEVREVLGDLQVPDGVDPSFLAALPTEMREEVIQEHLRAQRNRQRAQQNAIETEHESLIEVNPDFLAALPPSIQAEVLSQQRIEQRRQAAQTANPNDPVDAAEFFHNLQPSLRQAILTDMEDSQIASLPPDLVAEAQNLRRDWEHRNRQVLQDRLTNQTNSAPSLSGTANNPPRIPNLQGLRDRPSWHTNSIWYSSTSHTSSSATTSDSHSLQKSQDQPVALALMENEGSLLDVDALSCLLLLLFLDDAKFNLIRLHRVIRHLCYHAGTREWIINSLISIIVMADETDIARTDETLVSRPQNLTLRVDAALGYRSSVFLIKRGFEELFQEEAYCGEVGYAIRIHPQAAKMVCRNSLDLLLTLAKHFPRDFVPFKKTPKYSESVDPSAATESHDKNTKTSDSGVWCTNKAKKPKITHPNHSDIFPGRSITKTLLTMPKEEFFRRHPLRPPTVKKTPSIFDVLLKLDCTTYTFQPKYSSKEVASMFVLHPQPIRSKMEFMPFEESPFAQLLSLLPSTVIKRSPQLTDKIVRLLASLGMELPKEDHMQPFSVESDPIYVAELAMLGKPASTDQPAPSSVSSIKKSTRVIAVHDSDSEPDVPEDDDDESGSDYSSHSIKRRKLSGKLHRQPTLYPSEIQQLQIAVEVLTTKSCSEEGLEYATELIVHLSQCSGRANAIVVQLVIRGILGLAELVRKQIIDLMKEVKLHNLETAKQNDTIINQTYLNTGRSGIINDRFTAAQVVISAPTKCKPTCELQLPSMNPLIAKSSSQTFFLRTLKVFMQVRELIEYKALLTQKEIEPLSEVICLDGLWNTLSECLVDLEKTNDQHAVLILQPAVEAFFLIHASKKKPSTQNYHTSTPSRTGQTDTLSSTNRATTASVAPNTFEINFEVGGSSQSVTGANTEDESMDQDSNESTGVVTTPSTMSATSNSAVISDTYPSTSAAANAAIRESEIQRRDQKKFLEFAEKHRTVLNQILRQSPVHLSDGPFSVLVDHTRILDFDVKRKYFRTELERMDEGVRREELTVNVRRVTVFEDSFRELYRRGPEEWKNRFYIVFEDEEGQDAGGLLREWYVIISREIFNPMYALFCVSPGDRVTYMINPSSHANPNHLCYFKFVGRVIAKAIHDNKLLECYFTRSFYKHILGIQVKYTDMESQDYEFYKGLAYLMNNNVSTLGYDLTFSTEVQEFGVTQVRDLTPNGRNIPVTEENKFDYIRLVCQLKMSGSILKQLNAFLDGFYDIIPKRLISIFNEQELELLISGLPNVDIEDLKQNTEYHKYNSKSPQIQWFWRALRSFDQADRAKFLQFVTGTSKVPLQGFSALEGMNGIQKFQIHRDDRSTDRLPCAHTCFNQLDLPLYKSFDKLRTCLTKAIHECSEGFGFA